MTPRRKMLEDLMESFHMLKKPLAFKDLARAPHITPSQWMAMRVIDGKASCTVKDVAQNLGMTSSAATQLVNGLVRSRYVVRKTSAADRRKVTLTVSAKGAADITRMKKCMLDHMKHVFKVLTDEEFEQLYRLNKKISDSLSQ